MRLIYELPSGSRRTKEIPLKEIGKVFGITGTPYKIMTTLKDRGYTYEMILNELQRQNKI